MFKKIAWGVMIFLPLFADAYAHKLILSEYDNGDDTLTIKGKYDTGASAAGALVRLEALNRGDILFKKRLTVESELTVKIPDEPYQIVLDGGPGHLSIQKGIPPSKGFATGRKENQKAKLSAPPAMNMALVVSVVLAFCLLFSTIGVGIYNTNKILTAISNAAAPKMNVQRDNPITMKREGLVPARLTDPMAVKDRNLLFAET
jgi:hypothetical protein